MPPDGFSWVDPPRLAGLAMPATAHDFVWMRRNGIHLLVSLTEDPPFRRWVNDAGLMLIHSPIRDMAAPTVEQLESLTAAVAKAHAAGMGVAVHFAAGMGRTGTVLAAVFVAQGLSAGAAVEKIRHLRPGSIETAGQEAAVLAFAERRAGGK